MRKFIPAIDPAELAREYESGKTLKDVAQMIGTTMNTTARILREAGCCIRKRGNVPGRKMPRWVVEKAAESRRGMKMSDMARQHMSDAKKSHHDGYNSIGHKKVNDNGYVMVFAPDHPMAMTSGHVYEHRLVMEKAIGRLLRPDEIVHHINHDRTDNRIENLQLMTVHDHMSMHMRERNAQRRNDISTDVY